MAMNGLLLLLLMNITNYASVFCFETKPKPDSCIILNHIGQKIQGIYYVMEKFDLENSGCLIFLVVLKMDV